MTVLESSGSHRINERFQEDWSTGKAEEMVEKSPQYPGSRMAGDPYSDGRILHSSSQWLRSGVVYMIQISHTIYYIYTATASN